MDACIDKAAVVGPAVFFQTCRKGILLGAACATLLALPAQARDRGADVAIGVAVGTVLGIVAAKAADTGDASVYAAPVAPVLFSPSPQFATVPVYYAPPPVYYPPPAYYAYPVAPMPLYRGRYYRR